MGKNDEIEAKNAIFEQKMTIFAKNEQNREKTCFSSKMSKNDQKWEKWADFGKMEILKPPPPPIFEFDTSTAQIL